MFAEQGGNNVDNVIVDAYVKELPGIDWKEAYKVIKHDADYIPYHIRGDDRGDFRSYRNFADALAQPPLVEKQIYTLGNYRYSGGWFSFNSGVVYRIL